MSRTSNCIFAIDFSLRLYHNASNPHLFVFMMLVCCCCCLRSLRCVGGSGLQYSEAIDYSVGSSTSVAAPAVAPAAPESGSTAEASEAAREAHATRMRRLAVLLRPLLSALDGESAALAPVVAGNERGVHRMRVVLLALWACTLKLLAPALESYALRVDVGVAYSTLSRILLRAEFGPQYLMLDVHGKSFILDKKERKDNGERKKLG